MAFGFFYVYPSLFFLTQLVEICILMPNKRKRLQKYDIIGEKDVGRHFHETKIRNRSHSSRV